MTGERLAHPLNPRPSSLPSHRSGSHVVMLLVKKYPSYRIVNFDKLDYCSSLKNLESISDAPNYTFVKVRGAWPGDGVRARGHTLLKMRTPFVPRCGAAPRCARARNRSER